MFISAVLLFLVQPMVAKMVLPVMGGTPAVWNTCMLFFQTLLLAGYSYAHFAPRLIGLKRQSILHLVLLAMAILALPIRLRSWSAPAASENPIGWLLLLLTVMAGLPFFMAATGAPLLQRWFAATGHSSAADPYYLYVSSNLGSMTALVSYPLIVERALPVARQTWIWAAGYALLIVLIVLCAWCLWRAWAGEDAQEETLSSPLSLGQCLRWLGLSFVPSSMLLGVTLYITTDIAPVPLFWVVPLALYLLTFVIAFSRPGQQLYPVFVLFLPAAIFCLIAAPKLLGPKPAIEKALILHLSCFAVTALACHGELARTRPPRDRLTEYYLWISLGGALGGIFNGVVAPVVFSRIVEYPLVAVVACLLAPRIRFRLLEKPRMRGSDAEDAGVSDPFWQRVVVWTWAVFGVGAGVGMYWAHANPRYVEVTRRDFFGVLRAYRQGGFRCLAHGTTVHGKQSEDPRRRRVPVSYFSRTSGIGLLLGSLPQLQKHGVGIIGLGAGTLACYAERGECWTFYEIDPAVEKLARDRHWFTYLDDAEGRGAKVSVVLGDGRRRLTESGEKYGLIVIDAFSSDSIPVHLLTREAIQVYLRHLLPQGAIAFHITNRYLRLRRVLTWAAKDAGLACLGRFETLATTREQRQLMIREERELGKEVSDWVVLSRSAQNLGPLVVDPAWKHLESVGGQVWTDDYSNIMGVLRWQ
jgi:hypothetical protein